MILKLNSFSNVINSFTYNNIVSNGNFTSTTNWLAFNSTNSATANTLSNTGNGNSSSPYSLQIHDLSLISTNDKLYQVGKIRVTNADCSQIAIYTSDGSIYTKTQSTPTQNIWYTLSQVITIANVSPSIFRTYLRHYYSDAATANGKIMEVQTVMTINLTKIFGAGNEPSLQDCDNIFKFVDGNTQPNFSKQIAT